MKIKDIKKFREFVWETKEFSSPNYDIDFIGVDYAPARKQGFFKMFHGISRVEDSIIGMLKIADDEQAIYELVQNATDCNSESFELYYNSQFLVAFNDGKQFSKDDVIAILNESYSNKQADQIGRFGVGFKIVHKLVGSNQGKSELIDDKKGPILFSWNNVESLRALFNADEETIFTYDELESNSPWLFKILLTNFPIAPFESNIKDIDFVTISNDFFKRQDFKNLISYLKTIPINKNSEHGTIIFLDLGEGKQKILDKEREKVKDGLAYSLNFLKKTDKENELKRIIINEPDNPISIETLEIEPIKITIENTSLFADDKLKKNDESEIKFGYLKDDQTATLKEYPNLFKYFPLSEQKLGLNFILHSELFEIDKNRLKIEYNPKNSLLLEYFVKSLGERIEHLAKANISKYRNIFLAIYLSEDKISNDEIFRTLYRSIKLLVKKYIPTKDDDVDCAENVISNDSNIQFDLIDWGITNKKWFYWDTKTHAKHNESKYREKSGIYKIEKWDLNISLENCDVAAFNKWYSSLNEIEQKKFLTELDLIELASPTKLKQLKLFKFSDGAYYSANDTLASINTETATAILPKLIFHTPVTFPIKNSLEKLKFVTSNLDLQTNYPNLFELLKLHVSSKDLWAEVLTRAQVITLECEQKKDLFQILSSKSDALSKTAKYFQNNFGQEALNNLLKPNAKYPAWLKEFAIIDSEYYPELDDYLIKDENQLFGFLFNNWSKIITLDSVKNDISDFYKIVEAYHLIAVDKKLALTNLPIVFVNTHLGFKPSSEIYFHSSLAKVNYHSIKNAIKTLFNLDIPAKEALQFLSEENGVFQIYDHKNLINKFIEPSEQHELSKEDTYELLKFIITELNEPCFDHIVIFEKTSGIYGIRQKREEIIQISQLRSEIITLIVRTKKLNEKYIILPAALKESFGDSKGILNTKNGFYSALLADKELLDDPSDIFKYLFDSISQKKYIEEFSEILIPLNSTQNENASIQKILEWCLDEKIIPATEYETQRLRFKLLIGDKKIDITKSKGEVIIKDKTFTLSSLLPLSGLDKKNEQTSIFLKEYSSKGFDENRLKLFFGIEEDILPIHVYNILCEHKGETLNSRQIEFLILFKTEFPETDLSVFCVETISGESLPFNKPFFKQAIPYIKDSYILSDKYSTLDISLCTEKILSEYLLKENEEIDIAAIKDILSDDEKVSLLNFLYGKWMVNQEKFKNYKVDSLFPILGFAKFSKIINRDYAITDEFLPEFYETFLMGDTNKMNFSSDFGIFNDESLVVLFRKYFENLSPEQPFADTRSLNTKLAVNSLEWLRIQNIILSNIEHLDTIYEVYGLPIETNLHLFVSATDLENHCTYIIKKKAGNDCYIDNVNLEKLKEYKIPLKKIVDLLMGANKNLIIRSTYPERFNFQEDFSPIQIPDVSITIDELENLTEWDESYFVKWKEQESSTIHVYRFDGEIPRHISFENELIKLKPEGQEFRYLESYYVSNQVTDILESLRKILPADIYGSLVIFKEKYESPPPPPPPTPYSGFEKDLLFDIDELRGYYSPEILLALEQHLFGNKDVSSESQRNALNDLVKLKFLKNRDISYEGVNAIANRITINGVTYIFHSARGSFAYIKFSEIEEVKAGCIMVIDFGKGLENIFEYSFEQLLQLNFHHIYYQESSGNLEEVYNFVEKNSESVNLKMLLVDPNQKIARTLKLLKANQQGDRDTQIDPESIDLI